MFIQGNKQRNTFVDSILNVYAFLYKILDSLVQAHTIPSIGPFAETKGRNVVRQEIEEYLNQLKQVRIKEELEVN